MLRKRIREGDSMAEWPARRSRNPEVPGSSPAVSHSEFMFSVVSSSDP